MYVRGPIEASWKDPEARQGPQRQARALEAGKGPQKPGVPETNQSVSRGRVERARIQDFGQRWHGLQSGEGVRVRHVERALRQLVFP